MTTPTPTQQAIQAYIDLRRAGSNPQTSHDRAVAKKRAEQEEQRDADQGTSPLDTIRELRELFRADQAAAETQRQRSAPEPNTTALDNLAEAAVRVATLLGVDALWEKPESLLNRASRILKETGLPDPSDTKTAATYQKDALEVYAHAINDARGSSR